MSTQHHSSGSSRKSGAIVRPKLTARRRKHEILVQGIVFASALLDFLTLGDQTGLREHKAHVQSLLFLQGILWRVAEERRQMTDFFTVPCQKVDLLKGWEIRNKVMLSHRLCAILGADLLGNSMAPRARGKCGILFERYNESPLACSAIKRLHQGMEEFINEGSVSDPNIRSGLAFALVAGAHCIHHAVQKESFVLPPTLETRYRLTQDRLLDLESSMTATQRLSSAMDMHKHLIRITDAFTASLDSAAV